MPMTLFQAGIHMRDVINLGASLITVGQFGRRVWRERREPAIAIEQQMRKEVKALHEKVDELKMSVDSLQSLIKEVMKK